MCFNEVALIESLIISRRFIRIKAIQHLYAYYIGKQATYEVALEHLHQLFVPDVFAALQEDPVQLAQEKEEALAWFVAYRAGTLAAPRPLQSGRRVDQVVHKVMTLCEQKISDDVHRLTQGFGEAEVTVYNAVLRMIMLCVAWATIAKNQAKAGGGQPTATLLNGLVQNRIVHGLQHNAQLQALVTNRCIGWENQACLVEDWYEACIQQEAALQAQGKGMPLACDYECLLYLFKELIFEHKAVDAFFSQEDLYWIENKRMVKQIVLKLLKLSWQCSEKKYKLPFYDFVVPWEVENAFYVTLVSTVLEKEQACEELIAKKAAKWALDRIILLDKIILQLALCEFIYFPEIPVKVSIDEYIEIAKLYGTDKSSQFVNGLLDALIEMLTQQGMIQKNTNSS